MFLAFVIAVSACAPKVQTEKKKGLPELRMSENHRYLVNEKGEPFLWLGDTGWLLFSKLNREDAEKYLADHAAKGFNVIQVMMLHSLGARNFYGDSALIRQNVAIPLVTEGNAFEDTISDGKDWTASVPELEYPYLQRIYGFYNAERNISNVHLPNEGHDFGPNKRNAAYNFFINTFGLNAKLSDKSKVTVEPKEAMFSFEIKGEKMPVNAIRDFKSVEKYFNKESDARIISDIEAEKRAQTWIDSLNLKDKEKEDRVKAVILKHIKVVRDWHNEHPYSLVPEGINPVTGKPLSKLDREVIANFSKPMSVHEALMTGLRKNITEEQVEKILDNYTIGKVAFTMAGYKAIVTDITEKEQAYILSQLKLAREEAVDFKSMKSISVIFEIYKNNCEKYLNENGRSWKALYKAYTDAVKAKMAEAAKVVK
jgi:hypothetical protein